ncbi:hypothetical protein ABT224_40780 [Streptomyces sp. NPDC001584]|uniref:hypothetical protein n=1 Tax=Streptomyces sp. NPDC001584 TaxID=3154521 RepID=UPI00331664C2
MASVRCSVFSAAPPDGCARASRSGPGAYAPSGSPSAIPRWHSHGSSRSTTPFDSRARFDNCAGLSATEEPCSTCRIRNARSTAVHCAGADPCPGTCRTATVNRGARNGEAENSTLRPGVTAAPDRSAAHSSPANSVSSTAWPSAGNAAMSPPVTSPESLPPRRPVRPAGRINFLNFSRNSSIARTRWICTCLRGIPIAVAIAVSSAPPHRISTTVRLCPGRMVRIAGMTTVSSSAASSWTCSAQGRTPDRRLYGARGMGTGLPARAWSATRLRTTVR